MMAWYIEWATDALFVEPENSAVEVSEVALVESVVSADNAAPTAVDDGLFEDLDSSGSHEGAVPMSCDMYHAGVSFDCTITHCNLISWTRDIAEDAADEAITMAAYETVYYPGTDDDKPYETGRGRVASVACDHPGVTCRVVLTWTILLPRQLRLIITSVKWVNLLGRVTCCGNMGACVRALPSLGGVKLQTGALIRFGVTAMMWTFRGVRL